MRDVVGCPVSLNLNLLFLSALHHLRHNNAENAVLKRSRDRILINSSREAESAGEFTNAALRDPVRSLRLMGSGHRCRGGSRNLLAVLGLLRLGRRLGGLGGWLVMNFFYGRLTRLAVPFGPALDHEGVVVGELNGDVLLLDTGEFALEQVLLLFLFDIEAWGEGGAAAALCGVRCDALELVEGVIEEA